MVSLRFPFSFSHPNKPNGSSSHSFSSARTTTMTISLAAAATLSVAGFAISHKTKAQTKPAPTPFLQNALDFFLSHYQSNFSSPIWASLSLSNNPSDTIVESKTGASFPAVLSDSQRLLGIGLRKKSVMGLKNIDVYAFGVYADDRDVSSMLSEKYSKLSVSELKEDKDFHEDVFNKDICMTVRLQIVYGRLSMHSVRSAFEESIGSRLQKFAGPDNKDLVRRFTSQFNNEIKLPKGSVIDISRERGHVLCTTIDGNEVGCIQSKLLCRCVLDLYIGENSFDALAKEDIELNLASLLQR